MRVSFDLDGVIAETDRWFFRLLDVLRTSGGDEKLINIMEIDYYSSRPLKQHPNFLLAPSDKGFIITSRKPISKKATAHWLRKYNIILPIIYSDNGGIIQWDNYEEGSIKAGQYKTEVIEKYGIECHFDNNPYIVKTIRELLPNVKVFLVGGEECIVSEQLKCNPVGYVEDF